MSKTTVRVLNCNSDIWLLKLCLEAKANNGGKISTTNEGSGFVDVEFEDEQVARRFLEKGNIMINDTVYDIVSLPSTQKEALQSNEVPYLLISGLAATVTSDDVICYLKKQTGIAKSFIDILDFDSTERYVICNIEKCNRLNARVYDEKHTICGSDVKVIPVSKDLAYFKNLCCGIKVKMSKVPNDSNLRIIFEKRDHKIEELYINETEKTATITYDSPDGLSKYLDVRCCDDISFEVEQMIPKLSIPLQYDVPSDRYIFTNLPLLFDNEMVTNYFNKHLKNECISEVFYARKKPGAVLISFNCYHDFNSLARVVYSKPFCDRMLGMEQLPTPRSIQIFNTSGISPETLTNYFETFCNQKISGHFFGDDFAKLTFEDSLSLKKVGAEHILNGKKVNASFYHENFGIVYSNDSDCKCWSEKLFTVTCESLLVDLFMKSDKHRLLLEEELKKSNGIIEWPNASDEIKNSVKLRIKFDQKLNPTFCIKKLITWQDECEQAFYKLKQSFSIHDAPVPKDRFADIVCQLLGQLKKPKCVTKLERRELYLFDDVMIVVGDGSLTFSGSNSGVEETARIFEHIKCQEEDKMLRNQLLVTLKIGLIPWQMDCVKKKKILESYDVGFDVPNGCIMVTCPKDDLHLIEMEVWKSLEEYNKTNKRLNCDSYIIGLLNDQEIRNHVNNLLEENKIDVCLNVSPSSLFVCSPISEEVHSICDQVLSVLISVLTLKEIKLNEVSRSTLSEPEWENKIQELVKYPLVKITINDAAINISGIMNVVNAVEESLNSYFDEYAIYEHSEDIPVAVSQFVDRYRSGVVSRLTKEFEDLGGILKLEDKVDGKYFHLRGTNSILKTMKEKLKAELLEPIKKFDRIILKGEFNAFIESNEGKFALESISTNTETIIEISSPEVQEVGDKDTKIQTSQNRKYATVQMSKNCSVNIVFGSILDCDVDVIVNAANGRLNHVGGVAKVISSKAGPEMQEECSRHVGKLGELRIGDIFVSIPGSLKFEAIIHGVGPTYNKDNDRNHKLYELVRTILCKAEERNWKKIALPAISTGVYGFPLAIAIPIILESIRDFAKKSEQTVVVEVVDIREKVIAECLKVVREKFTAQEILFLKEISIQTIEQVKSMPIAENSKVENQHKKQKKRRLEFVVGSLVEQSVDVIVNSASNDLDLKCGTIAHLISKWAGPEMQKVCSEYHQNSGPLRFGDIFVSDGFQLPCKFVFHGACASWNSKNNNSEKSIRLLTKKSLEEANRRKLVSMAMPSFGTGRLNVPGKLVARWMTEETNDFFKENPNSSLVDVRLVVYGGDSQVIKDMEESFNPGAERKLKQNTQGSDRESGLTFETSKLAVEVCIGDLTEETTDGIVNVTNEFFDLLKGNLAKAILEKGGSVIRDECLKYGKLYGVAVTSGGSLGCKHIFHVVAGKGLVIRECLLKAEEMRLSSLSFPPITTGSNCGKTSETVRSMLDEFAKFAESGHVRYLEKVRVVLSDESAMQEIRELSKHQSSSFSRFLKSFRGTPDPSYQLREYNRSRPGPTKLRIYALTREGADAAFIGLEKALSTTTNERPIEDPVIGELNDNEIFEIMQFEKHHGVFINIDKSAKTIKLKGIKTATSKVHSSIVFDVIMRVKDRIINEDSAKKINEQVQWYFKSLDYKKYPEDINVLIERAYDAKKESVTWTEESGQYVVDFGSMIEFCPARSDSNFVKRVTKKRTYPLHWDESQEKVSAFIVSPESEEYKKVETEVKSSSDGNIKTICKIERIQNKLLYKNYQTKKEEITKEHNQANIVIEQSLWHAIENDDIIYNTNNLGFNRSKDVRPPKAVNIGQGSYFFSSFSYIHCSKPLPCGEWCAYRCQVLTGRYTKGAPNLRDVPQDLVQKFNSVVDSVNSPTTFAIFNDFQAYPEYLIHYMA